MTDAELVCIAVAQVLLRFDDERHWLRAAPKRIGHLFPRILRQSEYNKRVGHAGYGYCPSHTRWYWGTKMLLICTCDGTVTGFSLANPKLHGERDQARQALESQPVNRPAPGTAVVTDKGLSGQDFEDFLAGPDLGLAHYLVQLVDRRARQALTDRV